MVRQASDTGSFRAADLLTSGLLSIGRDCSISPYALFRPIDDVGASRRILIEDGCIVEPFSVLHGGTHLRARVRVEAHVIIGKPEHGYAVRATYCGEGMETVIGERVVLRAGVIAYGGVRIQSDTVVGHHTLLRSQVHIGADTQIGHQLTIERQTRIGNQVRCSPGSHITSSTVVEDGVFLGAGVRTINDNGLIWRASDKLPPLIPPTFRQGCRVGSGSVLLGGVVIGEYALIGAGSVVTRNVPARSIVFGNPARVRGTVSEQADSETVP